VRTIAELAASLDHALLQPVLRREELLTGCRLARELRVGALCVRPCDLPLASEQLEGSVVVPCTVIGFPHGATPAGVKAAEISWAMDSGARELDVVVNVGRVLDGAWDEVKAELEMLQNRVVARGALLKVIFENVYLEDSHRIRLCRLATELGIAFVKTSTGFGTEAVKGGLLRSVGARDEDVRLMLREVGPGVRVKASGGIKTLDHALRLLDLGVARIGTSSSASLIAEARARGMID
jgi:deoxyribose-phosphate aldolase